MNLNTLLMKAASSLPVPARVAARILGAGWATRLLRRTGAPDEEAVQMNAAFRELELARTEAARGALQHTQLRPMVSQEPTEGIIDSRMLPRGMDEGMVRLASAIGRELAKRAGVGGNWVQRLTGPVGLKGNLVAGAAMAGGSALAYKGVKKGLGTLASESQAANYGAGAPLAFGVNNYGHPQLGTPLS